MATDTLSGPVSRTRSRRALRRTLQGWLFIGPLILGILAFQFIPILVSLFASFTDWTGLTRPDFVGLENYITMITEDPFFAITLRNTVLFTLGTIPLTIGLALVLSVLCNQRVKGIAIFRTAYFVPYITNVVAISLVWFWFYQPRDGVLDGLLSVVGINGPAWLTDVHWALPAVILVSVWQGVGYPMVILLAGLQGIPSTFHEAATIDGASAWQRFWRVTMPLLTPTLFFLIITQFIASFQVFGIIFVMTQGGPANATNVYIYYLYQNAFSFSKMGYASAMAWVLFAIIAAVTVLQWRLQRLWVFYG